MVKKFSFDFKFLDSFKKKPVEPIEPTDAHFNESEINENELNSDNSSANNDENFDQNQIQNFDFTEAPPPPKKGFTKASELNQDAEYEDASSSEAFAEKTLGNFKIPNLSPEVEQLLAMSAEERKNNPDAFKEDEDDDHPINFDEMQPPTMPVEAKKPRFHFPSFNRDSFKNFNHRNINFKNSFQKIEKISWNDFVLKFFSPYSRGKIHNAFIVLLVIALTYLFGKTGAMFINRTTKVDIKPRTNIAIPSEKADSTVTDIGNITSVNLFNAKESEELKAKGPKIDISQIHCVEADRPTAKQIKLLDTIVLQDSVKSVASVQVRGATDLMNIREGETIDGSEVSRIQRMKLILKNLETGDCEYLASDREDDLNAPSPIKYVSPALGKSLFKSMNPNIKNDGNNFKIKKTFRDQMVTKMSDVLTQAKAIQITNPDGTMCFKMTEIVPGSIYSQLNIQENDIVCQINGRKIDNLNELMGLLGKIKEIDSMAIGLKRNGMQENLEYSFE